MAFNAQSTAGSYQGDSNVINNKIKIKINVTIRTHSIKTSRVKRRRKNPTKNPTVATIIKRIIHKDTRVLVLFRQRAYFEDVHILIPESWPDNASYSAPTWQQVDKSDVTVGPVPGAGPGQGPGQGGDAPFTVRTTPCGELGQFIHLTPHYLLNDSLAAAFGPYDKVKCAD